MAEHNIETAETHLINLVVDDFASFTGLPQKNLAQRAYATASELPSKCYSYFFKSKNNDSKQEENTPLLNPAPTSSFNWKKALGYAGLFGIGSYSAFMYWNSSEASAEAIAEQLKELFTLMGEKFNYLSEEAVYWAVEIFKFGIAKFCVAPTNMVLNSQVLFTLARFFADLISRSEAEKFLTGKVNPIPILLGLLLGVGAEFPFASLNEQAAKTFKAMLMGYFTGITSYPNYAYSSTVFLDTFLSRVKDDTAKNYDKEKKEALKKARMLIAARCYHINSQLLQQYKDMLTSSKKTSKKHTPTDTSESEKKATELKKLLDDRKTALKNLSQEKIQNKLHDFLEESKFFATEDYTQTEKTRFENIKNCFAECSKATFVVTPLFIVNLAMIFNDGLTAYYAGADLVKNKAIKIALGSLFGGLSGIASTGFSLSALRSFVKGESSPEDVVKTTNPKTFALLAGILVILALFSGGPSALEGYQSTMRLLKNYVGEAVAREISLTFEALGFVGGDSVNVPYVYFWARWFIHQCAKQQGDETLRSVLHCIGGYQALGDTLGETKLGHIETFLKEGTFGNTEELNNIGIGQDLLHNANIEIQNKGMINA